MKKIIAILLCISALFALGACGRLTEAKSESVKPEVYFTEDKSGTYTDSVGNVYNYSYKIPAFSGGSEDAERINKYFDDTLRPDSRGRAGRDGGRAEPDDRRYKVRGV